jgi:hypothetical protein
MASRDPGRPTLPAGQPRLRSERGDPSRPVRFGGAVRRVLKRTFWWTVAPDPSPEPDARAPSADADGRLQPASLRHDSVAMTEAVHEALVAHLVRDDGQEDVCLATYAVSTGADRTSCLVHTVELPDEGDRDVHGNATIYGQFVLRVASVAAERGHGVVLLHSHPRARTWQPMSGYDADTERSYAPLVEQITGLPLVGMTLAGAARTWSARLWRPEPCLTPEALDGRHRIGASREAHARAGRGMHVPSEVASVRVVSGNLAVSFNDRLVPIPAHTNAQQRTVSAWGEATQADIARLRVLVVGPGSVGLDIVTRIAATGVETIGVMDTDVVENLNRDRMIGATHEDARLRRRKVDVAERLALSASTTDRVQIVKHPYSVCSPEGLAAALDYDVIFCCVDRPWPRAVLNTIAYADLVPVIDGGIAIDTFLDGRMRGATRRVQTATPSRPCMTCAGQVSPAEVRLEMEGDLDDPAYIKASGREPVSGRPNVAALCAGVSASQLDHFVTLVAKPAGFGVPGPQRFALATGWLEHLDVTSQPFCQTELDTAAGDGRINLIRPGGAPPAERVAKERRQ